MPKPFACPHGRCTYCPGGIEFNTPNSYTGKEPVTINAIKNQYNPNIQYGYNYSMVQLSFGLPTEVTLSNTNNNLIYTPAILAASIYLGTILKTYQDVDNANQRLFRNHIDITIAKTPLESFMDFSEPNLVEN